MFRLCAERFGWTPQAVLEMTPQELAAALGAEAPKPYRSVQMTPQQYRAFLAARNRQHG